MAAGGLIPALMAGSPTPSNDEILARIESENNRRHDLLKEYLGSRQYTLQNMRFGKEAAVALLMSYRQAEGERYTILTRSGRPRRAPAYRRKIPATSLTPRTIGSAFSVPKSPRDETAMWWD
jgi:hypothetical protein